MRVKIGDKIYDSEQEKIMLILSSKDKENIKNMHPDADRFISCPDNTDLKELNTWADNYSKLKGN